MTAQELKNSILQLAVQGKLVPQDKNDEPASELLKRIEQSENIKFLSITGGKAPFDIPSNWQWVHLKEVAHILYGFPFDSSKFNTERQGIPLIRIRDILQGTTNTYTTEKYPTSYIIVQGDMLVGMDGNFNINFWQGEDALLNQRVCKVAANKKLINQKWLFYFLPQALLEVFNTVSYTTVKHLSDKHLTKMLVALPPLAEQQRIVDKIDELLPLIEEYGKAETRLKELKADFPDMLRKSILQQAIQGKLTERNPEDEPASELLKRIQAEKAQLIKDGKIKKEKPLPPITEDEIPFDIPDTWQWSSINELFWVTKLAGFEYTKHFTKERISSKNAVKIVRAQNVKMNRFIENENEAISEELSLLLERSALTVDCLLMTFIGAGIGDTCIYSSSQRHHLAPNVAKIVPITDGIYLPYYLIWLMSPAGQASVEKIKKSTAQPSLSMETIRSIRVAIPPLEEQKRIVARVEELLALCDQLK